MGFFTGGNRGNGVERQGGSAEIRIKITNEEKDTFGSGAGHHG
jgi:hypothetical protein